jgi:hypothetical protein
MYCSLRRQQVQQMLDNLALEGVQIGQANSLILKEYIDENLSGFDLLAQAYNFNTTAAYHDWWLTCQETLVGTPSLSISVEYVLNEFERAIRRQQSNN